MAYTHILAAVETFQDGDVILGRAQALAKVAGARLSVVTVVQYIPAEPMPDIALSNNLELTNELVHSAKVRLTALCARFGLPEEAGQVAVGSAGTGILSAAEDLGADLIVVGHHPRHGFFSGLFGHTDKSVVGGADCDVLAVKLAAE